MARVIGLDFGGVLCVPPLPTNEEHTPQRETLLQKGMDLYKMVTLRMQEHALGSVYTLCQTFGSHRVFIISKCPRDKEVLIRQWLDAKGFFGKGLLPEHVYFCRTVEEKAPICKNLKVTDFVDNRLSVLKHLSSVSRRYFFGNDAEELTMHHAHLADVVHVPTWEDALPRILEL